ncbi:MAG: DUF3153 domain-containing protein [Cyanobacteria bacterium]|nr:DUF3153 domain-containing protein [Cyanobacteriota bacterium]
MAALSIWYRQLCSTFGRSLAQMRLLGISVFAVLMLTGCVKYEVGLNFSTTHYGTIVQHIKLGQRFTVFSGQSAEQWLTTLEQRARSLGGSASRLSSQEVILTMPFYNGADLMQRFNQFFNPSSESGNQQLVELPSLSPTLTLQQTNALFAVRNHLIYDVDLQPLGVVGADGNQLINTSSLIELQLGLSTPWGATVLEPVTQVERVELLPDGHSLVWILKPGQVNHLEAIFWLPNPLGIGIAVIVIAVLGGALLRYRILSPPVLPPMVPFT